MTISNKIIKMIIQNKNLIKKLLTKSNIILVFYYEIKILYNKQIKKKKC